MPTRILRRHDAPHVFFAWSAKHAARKDVFYEDTLPDKFAAPAPKPTKKPAKKRAARKAAPKDPLDALPDAQVPPNPLDSLVL